MAIDNNSRLIAASKLQSNNAPAVGCGGLWIKNGQSLPAGDYVGVQFFDSTAQTTLDNIVWKGAPMLDVTGALLTQLTIDGNRISGIWYMNIESCDVVGGACVFYNRCK